MPSVRYGLASALVASVVLSVLQCRAPTEVTVTITTDDCTALDTTGITIGVPGQGTEGQPFYRTVAGCTSAKTIGSLVIVPQSGVPEGPFEIEVVTGFDHFDAKYCRGALASEAAASKHCIVERRILSFEDNDPQEVTIEMLSVCLGVNCPAGQTCDSRRQCVGAIMPPVEAGTLDVGLFEEAGRESATDVSPSDTATARDTGHESPTYNIETGSDSPTLTSDSGRDSPTSMPDSITFGSDTGAKDTGYPGDSGKDTSVPADAGKDSTPGKDGAAATTE